MTQPPVTLQEFNDFLNVDDPTSAGNEERWGRLVAAAELVEQRVGAMRPREVVETLWADGNALDLGGSPALSVTEVVPNGGSAVDLDSLYLDRDAGFIYADFTLCGRYEVTYTVGRDPVPLALAEATLIVAEQLWQSQRGPNAARKYTATGTPDAGVSMARGFAWPNRALELIDAYEDLGLA